MAVKPKIQDAGPKTPSARFLRDARAIARAWGCAVLEQRNRRQEQLAPVRAACGREDFPKKQARGWLRDEVMALGAAWVEVSKDKRTIKIKEHPTPNSELRTPNSGNGDLPIQPEDLNGGQKSLFNFTTEELRAAHILALKRIYAEGTRRLSPEEKRMIGVQVTDDDEGTDEIGGGHEGIAEAIRREFKVECHKSYVSDWLKGKRYPCPGSPPMPASHRSGFHKKSLVFPWYRQHVLKTDTGMDLPLHNADHRSRREKAEADMAEMAAELKRRESNNKWMLVADHESALRGAGAFVWARLCRCLEQELILGLEAQLKNLPPDAEIGKQLPGIMAEARRRHMAAVDGLQAEFKEKV